MKIPTEGPFRYASTHINNDVRQTCAALKIYQWQRVKTLQKQNAQCYGNTKTVSKQTDTLVSFIGSSFAILEQTIDTYKESEMYFRKNLILFNSHFARM